MSTYSPVIVQTQAPAQPAARYGLDMTLMFCSLDQAPQLVLLNDAVLQLSDNVQLSTLAKPSLAKKYRLLALYEAKAPIVDADALTRLGMTAADLALEVVIWPPQQIANWLAQQSTLLKF
ncbi:DsrE family protein [Idiomarina xiamenensis]|uniref:Sulfur relay protein TusC/DsrF n=1 Tax=Idiomarina xiamenensis 10-D-4 TaxID=740709 RepID=K2J9F4_9GAMM|nr:DsrE family protein [Idiomarina xiamenensis]EKE79851.1 sulfur relay protein TusC/DsrF [Idiomarina xiamenensis 10-D-4]